MKNHKIIMIVVASLIIISVIGVFIVFSKDSGKISETNNTPKNNSTDSKKALQTVKQGENLKLGTSKSQSTAPKLDEKPQPQSEDNKELRVKGFFIVSSTGTYSLQNPENKSESLSLDMSKYSGDPKSFANKTVEVSGVMAPSSTPSKPILLISSID